MVRDHILYNTYNNNELIILSRVVTDDAVTCEMHNHKKRRKEKHKRTAECAIGSGTTPNDEGNSYNVDSNVKIKKKKAKKKDKKKEKKKHQISQTEEKEHSSHLTSSNTKVPQPPDISGASEESIVPGTSEEGSFSYECGYSSFSREKTPKDQKKKKHKKHKLGNERDTPVTLLHPPVDVSSPLDTTVQIKPHTKQKKRMSEGLTQDVTEFNQTSQTNQSPVNIEEGTSSSLNNSKKHTENTRKSPRSKKQKLESHESSLPQDTPSTSTQSLTTNRNIPTTSVQSRTPNRRTPKTPSGTLTPNQNIPKTRSQSLTPNRNVPLTSTQSLTPNRSKSEINRGLLFQGASDDEPPSPVIDTVFHELDPEFRTRRRLADEETFQHDDSMTSMNESRLSTYWNSQTCWLSQFEDVRETRKRNMSHLRHICTPYRYRLGR